MTSESGYRAAPADSDAGARVVRLAFYGLLAIVLMTLDYRGHHAQKIRTVAWRAAEPLFLIVELPFDLGRRLGEQLRSHHGLMQQIRTLESERIASQARLALLAELQDDNHELRTLLGAAQRISLTFRTAELMSLGLNPWSHRVLVNRGRSDGVRTGQPVMDAHGVMGQVDEAGFNTAQVILISDPDHALPVRVQRTGLRTVAYGTGHIDRLQLNDLPMNVDLEPGDRLLTSGLDDVFPAGLPVAEVQSLERPTGEAFARAELRPLARLDRARHVLIVEAPEQPQPLSREDDSGAAGPEKSAADSENGGSEGREGET